ncbi:phage tail tape measure protein [Oceanicella sp. SM1341]|uniref:phage tail tape measure protein n=1 Tax=Oceanicella sp. SM1341 TaxID=1548889 RepID=UPI001E55FC11|nr:phage tail tape measure protein [Oceanicella sp. SM1341]
MADPISDDEFGGLEEGFSGAQSLASAFRAELEQVQAAMRSTERESRSLSRTMGSSLRGAFEGLVFDGARVSDVLSGIGRSVGSGVFSAAIRPVQNALGTGVEALVSGLMPFAQGGVFGAGRVRAFAQGGIVDSPTYFGMRGGTGLMGEAGPEAIMPLARGPDGKLGVRGAGGGVQVNVTVNTPDVEGFRRSQAQIAASLGRAMRRGQRNL